MSNNVEEQQRQVAGQQIHENENDEHIIIDSPPSPSPGQQQPPEPAIIIEDDDDGNINIEAAESPIISNDDEIMKLDKTTIQEDAELKTSTCNDHPSHTPTDHNIIEMSSKAAITQIEEKLNHEQQPPIMAAVAVTPPKITVSTATAAAAVVTPSSSPSPSHDVSIHDVSITSSITDSKSELSTIQRAYNQFQQNKTKRSSCFTEGSSLHDIMRGYNSAPCTL